MNETTLNISGFTINATLWKNLRNCQKESISIALKYLRQPLDLRNNKSCLISLPTGAGKTGVIAVTSHKATQRKVLILCHRRAVCNQLIEEISGEFFKKTAGDHTTGHKPVFEKISDTRKDGIYISTFQKLQSLSEKDLNELKNNIDLIIIDEGHSEPSPVWKNLVRGAKAHKIIITATPYRNDLFQFDINASASYIYTFEKALCDEIVREPEFHTIQSDNLTESIKKYLADNPNTKCIVKCSTFADIENYFDLLSKQFKTLAVHDQYTKDSREHVTTSVPSDLKNSDYQVIIHQRKLDEGVDIPQAKLLILTYPVNSGRELVQTIGRVVRIFGETTPKIFEFDHDSNFKVWQNYRYFDSSLSSQSAVKKFIASLDASKLIEQYLDSFPDASYSGNRFIRKFDINSFDPNESLVIPTASVCFLKKNHGFSIQASADLLYWRSNNSGELAKQFNAIGDMKIIISIAFNKSKFLKDQFLFEPSLEVTLLKEIEPNIVAIYDSRGRRFNNDTGLNLGTAVDQDQLLQIMSLSPKSITKETSSRSVSTARRRPESVSMKGENLEQIANLQNNSAYRVSTLRFDAYDQLQTKSGSFYLGIDSGRISDQKESQFSLYELNEWLSTIELSLKSKNKIKSALIHSFAKPIPADTRLKVESLTFDFSELRHPIKCSMDGEEFTLDNSFLYYEYDTNILLNTNIQNSHITATIQNIPPHLILKSATPILYSTEPNIEPSDDLIELLTEHLHKALLENGISYSQDKFYELQLPSQSEFNIASSSLANIIIPMKELKNKHLDEKGYLNGTIQTKNNEFSDKSAFHLVDKLKSYSLTNPSIFDLGPFYQYIPAADLILCTDMDTEPADFILSSPSKLIYVHIKCGASDSSPQSSAGALSEVGNQAIKNLEMLISGNRNLKAANWNTLLSQWPRSSAPQLLTERIRLFEGKIFSSNDNNTLRERTLEKAWGVIADRRRSSTVQKEIWIVAANSFSASHFETALNAGHNGRGQSLQAYQLIHSWLTSANSNDVTLKIFVAP